MSEPLSDDELDELDRFTGEATPGPWEVKGTLNLGNRGPIAWHVGPVAGEACIGCGERDAAFIARARTAVPALIAEVRRARLRRAPPRPTKPLRGKPED